MRKQMKYGKREPVVFFERNISAFTVEAKNNPPKSQYRLT
jgi:hypothetical protein